MTRVDLQEDLPHFLLSNDDGFRAPGVQELARALTALGRVTVVAPDGPRSGYASAISTTAPLRLKERLAQERLSIYSVVGTPADCVKLALHTLFANHKPTLIISGINHGSNEGISVHYSGTIGAAKEGAVVGIPSLAVSLDDVAERPDFTDAIAYTLAVVRRLLTAKGLNPQELLSLNVPKTAPRGLRVCPQAVSRFVGEFFSSPNAKGQTVYWMTGEQALPQAGTGQSDIELLRAGWATLTPLTLDLTAHHSLEQVGQVFADLGV